MMTAFEKLKNELMTTSYTWLITGVAGFIGSHLLEMLLQLNQKVVGLDNFSTGFRHNLNDVFEKVSPALRRNFILHEGDICRLEDCQKAVANVDYVLHQAALGSVPRSIETPAATNATNVGGFLNMLIAARQANVKRFVYASSSSVYGDSTISPKTESYVGNPLSPYAVSKYTNELYAKVFANCYGVENIGLRYFNIFGPRQNRQGPYAAVIPLWISSLLKDEPVYINGDGLTSRDFCYVDNAVEANLLAATVTDPAALNQVYNITVGEETTLNALFQFMTRHLNVTKQPYYRAFRQGDIRHSLADIERAKQLLGYSANVSLATGLQKTMTWFCLLERAEL